MKLLKKKSWRIVFFFTAAAFALLWISRPAPAPETMQGDDGQYPVQFTDEQGFIGIVYSDNEAMTETSTTVYFTNDAGEMGRILTDTPMNYLQYNGDYVSVHYEAYESLSSDGISEKTMLVTDIATISDSLQSDTVRGNTRWVNIACRFGDLPNSTPQPIEYFQSLMVNEAPGMDNYWRITSDRLVDIEGSGAFGWYDLPRTKAYYSNVAATNTGAALRQILTDCAQLAAREGQVDFSQYGGINIMLNDTFGCCAWGGQMPLNVDGKMVQFRTTWLPPWAFNSLHVIAHEMGHGWGLPHSSGPYGKVYDSAWDVMSGGNSNHTDAICRVGSEPLGCWQVGTIGLHLGMLGWIPDNRIVTVERGATVTVTLESLTTLGSTNGELLILIPISGSNNFYTVEARSFVEYDRNLPGEAIILHQVVPTRASPANVVDGDNNGNPNDAGAMWTVGETYKDNNAGITVEVVSNLGTSFTVRVTNK